MADRNGLRPWCSGSAARALDQQSPPGRTHRTPAHRNLVARRRVRAERRSPSPHPVRKSGRMPRRTRHLPTIGPARTPRPAAATPPAGSPRRPPETPLPAPGAPPDRPTSPRSQRTPASTPLVEGRNHRPHCRRSRRARAPRESPVFRPPEATDEFNRRARATEASDRRNHRYRPEQRANQCAATHRAASQRYSASIPARGRPCVTMNLRRSNLLSHDLPRVTPRHLSRP